MKIEMFFLLGYFLIFLLAPIPRDSNLCFVLILSLLLYDERIFIYVINYFIIRCINFRHEASV